MPKLKHFLAVLFVVAAAIPAFAQSDAQLDRIRDGIQRRMDQLHASYGFPGATAGFVLPDGRSGATSIGVSDLKSKRPMAPDDLLLAGSIGKTFVAAVMIQLAQEGKVNLDDKIERWFKTDPWFARLPNAKDITIRMLLQHTSGISNHVESESFFKAISAQPDRV